MWIMSLGQAIITYRQKHHLTQADLAGQLFVTRQAVSTWETNKAWPDTEILTQLNTLMATDFVKPSPPETPAAPSDAVTVLLLVIAIIVPIFGLIGPLVILFNRRFPHWSKTAAGVVIAVEVLAIVAFWLFADAITVSKHIIG
ncbi:helix-turn-helix domain-containing protein [Schleiferilactobacillus harbinensis]|uniref:Helix-turn-helix domain-containing protein n=3 Tax=Schleiferilactobacillus harbinensis TaxID=304207 RepID=A0A5P8M0E5_9LACO|nr:helix-turn-helix domain-containing protein [Schleiferilactobacillus harbinensis]